MRKFIVHPSSLKGSLTVPPSKSQTMRAILFGAFGKGITEIHHYLHSPDTLAMLNACNLLGAKIQITPEVLYIEGINGQFNSAEDVINAGNSGIILRFITAIAALGTHHIVLTGDYSIRNRRPMNELLNGLIQLQVEAISTRNNGFAPIIIRGPLKPGNVEIKGEDSQPVSALLIAAAFAQGPIEIKVNKPGEIPWVNLTLSWLSRLGISFINKDFSYFSLQGRSQYLGFSYNVPGDLSSALFPVAAALVTGSELYLKNIDMHDLQGDKEVIHILRKMGAKIDIDEVRQTLMVKRSQLQGITIDANNFIDAVPILAVVASFAEGETKIINSTVAKQKECDRLKCIAAELNKMNGKVLETTDGLLIHGSSLKGASLDSHEDHRMAMSLTVASLGAKGNSMISGVDCIAKTFPHFDLALQSLGAQLEVVT
jgi:3-phosphoshikimate 1-carboxyvinyltransferase